MILKRFYPKKYVRSAYDIPYESFYRNGIRGVIFDVDNTLVPHGAPSDGRAEALFERLRQIGLKTCLMSNNREARVAPFAQAVDSDYLYKAGKPKKSGYRQAMDKMGTKRAETLFVGDQLFTDIWGANRSGLYSILVEPINPREEIQIVLKRRLEWIVLWFYKRSVKNRQIK